MCLISQSGRSGLKWVNRYLRSKAGKSQGLGCLEPFSAKSDFGGLKRKSKRQRKQNFQCVTKFGHRHQFCIALSQWLISLVGLLI